MKKARKMFISSNLATSIDGKIATVSRVHFPLGSKLDRDTMRLIRRNQDAILMGASSLRASRKPLLLHGAKKQPINVILSSKLGGIDPRWPYFKERSVRRVLFITQDIPPELRRKFEESSQVIRLRPSASQPVALQIIDALGELGVKRLLVEGGGEVMWDFAKLDLIDEYYMTLVPRVVGGRDAPTMVDGTGLEPPEVLNLRLKKLKRVGNELYLVYARTGRRG